MNRETKDRIHQQMVRKTENTWLLMAAEMISRILLLILSDIMKI